MLAIKISFTVVDHLIRRWALPLTLLAASLLRYNLFSFVYLLLFIVGVVIPSSRLQKQRWSSVIYYGVLLVVSLLFTLGQVGFQIALATGFTLDPCVTLEVVLRQSGLILYTVPAVDVVRHLLPDVVVFGVACVGLGVSIKVALLHVQEESETPPTEGTAPSPPPNPVPSSGQEYFKVPSWYLVVLDVLIFFVFLLCGVSVPSLSSFGYFLVFLCLAFLWSFHLKWVAFVRTLRVIALFYSAGHMSFLYLYQFQSLQLSLPVMPNDTDKSLTVRLLGLTPLIQTSCARPTELLTWPNLPTAYIINPWALIGLYWILAIDFQFWLTTPAHLWSKYNTYFLPLLPQTGGSEWWPAANTESAAGGEGNVTATQYGATEATPPTSAAEMTLATDDVDDAESLTSRVSARSLMHLWDRLVKHVKELCSIIMSVNYVVSLIAMMVWSVLYPSWLALVLLLWALTIWLFPRINPKNAFYITSPFLLLYSVVLVLMQYVHSLNLTSSELSWDVAIGTECSEYSQLYIASCKAGVLGIKSILMLSFCASVRQFISEVGMGWFLFRRGASGRGPANVDSGGVEDSGNQNDQDGGELSTVSLLYMQLQLLLTTYWILVVVGAFLLVILAGDASILKSVYIVFFFFFLVIYQLSSHWWPYINFPFWCILVVYATIHLILVYTFPFPSIHKLWTNAYDKSSTTGNFTASEFFNAIGFLQYTYSVEGSRSLFLVLVPLAIFIAVLVLQLRYFTPKLVLNRDDTDRGDSESVLSLGNFISRLSRTMSGKNAELLAELEKEERKLDKRLEGAQEDIDSHASADEEKLTVYRMVMLVIVVLRRGIVQLWHLFWRFMELHLHKAIVLALFALSLYEVSATYFILVVFVVLLTFLSFLETLLYPIVTLYLGVLCLGKFLFQIELVEYFTFKEDCAAPNTSNVISFNYTYSPTSNDSSWIGLNKAAHETRYIAWPLLVALLISIWYSTRRQQRSYRLGKGIIIERWEFGSLFLGVSQERIHLYWIDAIKYLINHFFEMYGVEVCMILQAILIAVRIDVYGVVGAIILGAVLLCPRQYMRICWPFLLLIQALQIPLQYLLLLGAPPSLPCNESYPWEAVTSLSYGVKLMKWLFLPYRGTEILNRDLLYVNLVSFICFAQQMKRFFVNPIHFLPTINTDLIPFMYDTAYFLDYLKIIVFQYYFWVALFVLFVAGAFGLDVFGLVFLLACFLFLYQGQTLLTHGRRTRKKWWVWLRAVTYAILLIRIAIELIGCVFVDQININRRCGLIGVFNFRCSRRSYYGISNDIECDNGTESSTGLWFDILSFAVITLQIILLNTDYADQVAQEILEKEENAVNFAEIMNEVLEDSQKKRMQKQLEDLEKLQERADTLRVTEGTVAHLLHAGTRVPPEYLRRKPSLKLPDEAEATPTSEKEEEEEEEEEVKSKDTEVSKLKKVGQFLLWLWLEVVDHVIRWLEENSSEYVEVLKRVRRARTESAAEATTAPMGLEEDTTSPQASAAPKATSTPAPTLETSFSSSPEESRSQSPKEEKVKSKARPLSRSTTAFDQSSDFLLETLRIAPSRHEEERAVQVTAKLEELSSEYSKRPRQFLRALYYWILSHFEYVVFFLIILVILRTGSLISFVYAAILFLWGLLYVPWPSKHFWVSLLFLTMFVLVLKYIYYFTFVTFFYDQVESPFLGTDSGVFSWIFGIQVQSSYFVNSVFYLLLLMSIIFHRGLLKQHGLWHSTNTFRPGVNFIKVILMRAWSFLKSLLSPELVAGNKDYYISMLTFDVLCFITIVLGYSQFTVSTSSTDVRQVARFIQSNNIPLPFLIMLFLQFISMLIDRAIYLRHSIRAKFIFYVILLLGWHIWLLIVLPILTNVAFINNSAAQMIYLFKSLYFILSALQMVSGYPTRLLGYFVGKSYNTVSGIIFIGYRAIPILPELRDVMDWIFTDTSLSLTNWLRVQEIWAQLYQIKVQREREKLLPRDLGDKQSLIIKLFLGGLLLVLLVLLIWGPLLIISFVNQTGSPNPPIFASVEVHLGGFQLLDIQAQNSFIHKVSAQEFENLRADVTDISIRRDFYDLFNRDNFRRILFPGNSSLLWTASEPSKEQLKTLLSRNNTHELVFTWTLRRTPGSGVAIEVVSGSKTTYINGTETQQFLANLNGNFTTVNLDSLYPTFISAPANDMSVEYTSLSALLTNSSSVVNCTALLNQTLTENNITINQWWTLTQSSKYIFTDESGNGALEMIVYSEPVVSEIFSYISNLGIIGLYVSVVLVISKFVRNYVNSLALDIMIDEITYPDRLLELCDDIFNIRESKNFVLEEILTGRLIYIFRSPKRLLEITKMPKTKLD